MEKLNCGNVFAVLGDTQNNQTTAAGYNATNSNLTYGPAIYFLHLVHADPSRDPAAHPRNSRLAHLIRQRTDLIRLIDDSNDSNDSPKHMPCMTLIYDLRS